MKEKWWEKYLTKVANFFFTFKQKVEGIKCHKNSKIKMLRDFKVVKSLKYFLFYFMSKNTRIFISNTVVRNARLKLAKNQANAKQQPEAKLLLLENY